jgi:hypothetical protein
MKKPPDRKAFQIVVLAMKTTIGKSGKSQNSFFQSPVWKGFPSDSSKKRASPKSSEPRSRSVWRRPRDFFIDFPRIQDRHPIRILQTDTSDFCGTDRLVLLSSVYELS